MPIIVSSHKATIFGRDKLDSSPAEEVRGITTSVEGGRECAGIAASENLRAALRGDHRARTEGT